MNVACKTLFARTVLCAALLVPLSVLAVDDAFYYAIGGGEPLTRAVSTRSSALVLGAGVEWNTSLMCGDFDMSLSVSQQLNGIKGAFQDMMDNVISSATGAVSSLPALVIQRVNPALYDLLQNGILQAGEEFHVAKTSCEEMVGVMDETVSGGGWGAIARGRRMGREAEAGTEILEAEDKAKREGGNDGIVWAGGQERGGLGQPPIKVVEDAAKAGYNITLNRDPADESGVLPLACDDSAICKQWTTPQAMADWVTGVIGDKHVQTCQEAGCEKTRTKAGLGLNREVERETKQIQNDMDVLVALNRPPTKDELAAVSGGETMKITRNVMEALREEGPAEQAMITRRLASEMAVSRTVEKAMLARRALLAGKAEPNIDKTEEAQIELAGTVQELEQEIDNLLYEMEVRQKISTSTAAALLERGEISQSLPMVEPTPGSGISLDGGIEK
ncbi:MAG: integrating conjugative element protein [Parahaliea sp.]